MHLLRRPAVAVVISIVIIALVAGGALVLAGAFAPNPNEVCSGVPRDMGGCDRGQPTFSGATCSELGRQVGSEIDTRGSAIIDGPETVSGQSRASRMAAMTFLVLARANQYLRERGLVTDCGVDEFLSATESQFSDAFKSRVGDHLYDGTSSSYSEWLGDLRRAAGVIDMEEDEPFFPPSS